MVLIGGLSLAETSNKSARIKVSLAVKNIANGEEEKISGFIPRYSAINFKKDRIVEILNSEPPAVESALFEATIIFLGIQTSEDFLIFTDVVDCF